MTPSDPDYVEAGMRKIADFERRASGQTKRTPKNTLFQTRNGAAAMLNHTTETLEAPPPPRHRTRVPDNLLINGEPVSAPAPVVAAVPAAPISLLDIIMRAGSDPDFDVAKFERLVHIQREEQDRQDARADREAELAAEAAFNAAMSDVQKKMTAVRAAVENTQTRSFYADYAALDRMLRPIYSAADFALTYGEEDSPKADHVRVFCLVTHSPAGARRSHTRKYHTDMPADGKGARGGDVMSRTHATKSAFTYSQGALVRLIFNIAVSKDDDGNAAGAKVAAKPKAAGTISDDQAQQIRVLLDAHKVSPRAFLQFVRLDRIEDIGIAHFDRAITKIKSFGRQS